MFYCNQSQPTRLFNTPFVSFAMAMLIVNSFATYSNAQSPDLLNDREIIKELVKEFEGEVKEAFEKGNLLKKDGLKLNGKDIFTKATGGEVAPQPSEVNTLWDVNSDLTANSDESVGLTADPSAAYGLFGFMAAKYDENGNVCKNKNEKGKPLTLRITGKFPKAKYMSLQIYRGRPLQGSKGVGKPLSDYEISPKPNTGINPWSGGPMGEPLIEPVASGQEGTFEIYIRPVTNLEAAEAAAEQKGSRDNTIYYEVKDYDPEDNGDSTVITGFYRAYLPDDKKIEGLPKIEAFLTEPGDGEKFSHEDPVNLGKKVRPQFAKLVNEWYSDIPVGNIIFNVSRFWQRKESLRWFNVNKVFKVIEKFAGQGASQDLRYEMCFKQVAVGEYVVIKFRAPSLYFGGDPDKATKGFRKVRYWSLCSVYYPRLDGMNSLPCDPKNPGERDIIVVFGKKRPKAEQHAARLGATFLPDNREESHRVVTFLMRNILPTNKEDLADASERDELADPEKKHKLLEAIRKLREIADEFEGLSEKTKEQIKDLEAEVAYLAEVRWMFHGDYRPRGEVYSLREFLDLKPSNDPNQDFLNEVVGDDK